MPSGLTNEKADDVGRELDWGRGGGFPRGNVRWAYRLSLGLDNRFLVRR
jgi:hypothetical protein